MRVFLSYGHDRNTPLIQQIRSDLEAAGHTVWIDTSQIKFGDDWRRSILDGIEKSDWTLGFLSRHSTRDPGVCLDELAIALHVRGGAIATVMVESEQDVLPPVSVSHIQWLDMHEWAAKKAAGRDDWDTWYRGKIGQILALLTAPATQRFAGEIEELDQRLRPIGQESELGLLVDGFVGRAWLLEKLDNWRKNASGSRLFWLTGAPGSGKSAFAAWLAHRGKVNVIGLNLCRYNIDERRDAARVFRTLAFQMATRLPDYRRLLLDRLQKHDPDGSELARSSPAEVFDRLLAEPLRFGIDGGRREHRYVLVIDALDETLRDGRSDLAEILAESVQKLPPWIAVVATSRPDEPILRQFAQFSPQVIAAESAENLDDLRTYVRSWLSSIHLLPDDGEALIERVVSASQGNFLYVRMLREAISAGTLELSAPEGLPRGLIGLYERWFRRQFPSSVVYQKEFRPLLDVLVAAKHPVPEPWLAGIFGWSKPEQARMLSGLGSLFERRPDGVAPFHKSVRDWLEDDRAAGADFVVDVLAGARRLAAELFDAFVRWALKPTRDPLDRFCEMELPAQIGVLDAERIRAAAPSAPRSAQLVDGLFKVGRSLAGRHVYEQTLAWWQMSSYLAGALGGEARDGQVYALLEAGDVLSTLGRSADAHRMYAEGLDLAEQMAAEASGNSQVRRALSVSLERMGKAKLRAGDLAAAIAALERSTAITLANGGDSDRGGKFDLSASLNAIADAKLEAGDLPGAFEAIGQSLAIGRRLVAEDSSDVKARRRLTASIEKMGDAKRQAGDHAGALICYEEQLAIDRGLAADLADTDGQRGVALALYKAGCMKLAMGDQSAIVCFEQSIGILRPIAAADRANVELQRELTAIVSSIGDAKLRAGDYAAALVPYEEALAISRALATSDAVDVRLQRDVAIGLMNIGGAHERAGDMQRALKAYEEEISIARKLATEDPENALLKADLARGLLRMGSVKRKAKDEAGALLFFEEALAVARKLNWAAFKGEGTPPHVILNDIGVLKQRQGDKAGARAAYQESAEAERALLATRPDDVNVMGTLMTVLGNLGDLFVETGDWTAADAAFAESFELHRRLASARLADVEPHRRLMIKFGRLGDRLREIDKRHDARRTYERALAVARALADADKHAVQARTDVVVSLLNLAAVSNEVAPAYGEAFGILTALDKEGRLPSDWRETIASLQNALSRLSAPSTAHGSAPHEPRSEVAPIQTGDKEAAISPRDQMMHFGQIGDQKLQAGDHAGALADYDAALSIARFLAGAVAGDVGPQRDLIVSLNKVGTAKRLLGDAGGALLAYQESVPILRNLAGSTDDTWSPHYLSVVLERIGDLTAGAGDRVAALKSYEESLSFARRVARAAPDDVSSQVDVVASLTRVASVSSDPGGHYREALEILTKLDRDGRLRVDQRRMIEQMRKAVANHPSSDAPRASSTAAPPDRAGSAAQTGPSLEGKAPPSGGRLRQLFSWRLRS